MRPVTCCDQTYGFRREAVHPPFCFPSCLAFVERCFLLLSVFVCVWTLDMVMVGMRDGLAYSRDPLKEWTHNCALPVLADNKTSWKNMALELMLSGPSTRTGHLMFEFKLLHMKFLMGIVSMSQFQRAFVRQNRKNVCSLYCKRIRSGRTKQMQMNFWGQSSMPPPRLTLTVMFCLS